jgi:hypothetical protein
MLAQGRRQKKSPKLCIIEEISEDGDFLIVFWFV